MWQTLFGVINALIAGICPTDDERGAVRTNILEISLIVSIGISVR
jgi:hypothetical protein